MRKRCEWWEDKKERETSQLDGAKQADCKEPLGNSLLSP